MHDCDKDGRIKSLENEIDKRHIALDIIKIILTPKMIISVTVAICVLVQTICNLIGG